MKITSLEKTTVEVPSSHLQKYGILYLLPEERSHKRNYLLFFFPRGDGIDPVVVEYHKRAHLNEN